MFSQTWKKYLPVIAIMIKRSASGPQTLSLNHTDFERAAGGRKVKYTFSNLLLNNARIQNLNKQNPLAKEFGETMQENAAIKQLLLAQEIEFSMSGSFQLTIKNHTAAAEETAPATDEVLVEENATTEAASTEE
jgi:hypothetical protein